MSSERSSSIPKYSLESNNRLHHIDSVTEEYQLPQLQTAKNINRNCSKSSSLAAQKKRDDKNRQKCDSLMRLVYRLCLIVTCGASGLIILSVIKFLPKELTFEHQTVGIPSPGKVFNNTKVSSTDLPYFDKQFNQLFIPYNDTNCQYARFGFDQDGGYVICKNFLPQSSALINVGINSEDSFGCHFTANFPIPNYQYDCKNTYQPSCASDPKRNLFFSTCLGEKTEKTQLYTFSTYQDVLRVHNLTDKHVTLKLDCEGCEYSIFKALPMKYLDLIDQIVIEVHLAGIYAQEWGMLDIFRSLGDKFVSVNYHNNNVACLGQEEKKGRRVKSIAIELTLVNRRLISLFSDSRSWEEHKLNRNNWFGRDGCS